MTRVNRRPHRERKPARRACVEQELPLHLRIIERYAPKRFSVVLLADIKRLAASIGW